MAEKKPLTRTGALLQEITASDTIPAANVPAINLAGTGPGGVTGDLPLGNIAQGGATDGQSLLWNNTGGTWEPGTPAGGGDVSDGDTLGTGLTFPNTGLHILDTNASHDLIISPGSDLTADRTLTITTGDSNRTLTLSGNTTLSGTNTGDQTITLTGDVTGSGTGSFAATIGANAVTFAKMQAVSANVLLGNDASGTAVQEITCTQAGRDLLDDADAAAQRTTLGVEAAGTVTLTAAPSNNLTATGVKITLTANENQAFGDVCFINSDGEAQLADADAAATSGAIFMCTGTVTTGNPATYLALGIARNDTWAWTVGGLIYLSTAGTTGNTLTQTAPSGSGDIVQILGVATHADRMYFKPELVQIEVA
ncbi:MAG: hypothetical protein IPK73_30800 [Candidatus Obscuribacter sp.]|nr:hypothetical protein [Candidatus Obscuribacter sp.]